MLTTKPIALITGASSGIGHSLCEEFAKDGYDLILTARSVEKMQIQGYGTFGEFKDTALSATLCEENEFTLLV